MNAVSKRFDMAAERPHPEGRDRTQAGRRTRFGTAEGRGADCNRLPRESLIELAPDERASEPEIASDGAPNVREGRGRIERLH